MTEPQQANFEGWAVIEMMGHRKEIGFVTTQAFGQAVLSRVDTPELPEREFELTRPEYADFEGGQRWSPAGTKVKREAVQARSCLVAPSSWYAMNPCTEQAARAAIERSFIRPLILVQMPEGKALPAATEPDHDEADDYCTDCGRHPEQCKCEEFPV